MMPILPRDVFSPLTPTTGSWPAIWNGTGTRESVEIDHLEREYTSLLRPASLVASPDERQRILALAQDLSMVWHASTTTYAERKQLLRFLIKDITLTKRKNTIHIGVRWQTGALNELDVSRPKCTFEIYRTSPATIERIRELAPTDTDRQIATLLNQEGITTGVGQPFIGVKVRWVRHRYDIPPACPDAPSACPNGQRGDGRYSTQAALSYRTSAIPPLVFGASLAV